MLERETPWALFRPVSPFPPCGRDYGCECGLAELPPWCLSLWPLVLAQDLSLGTNMQGKLWVQQPQSGVRGCVCPRIPGSWFSSELLNKTRLLPFLLISLRPYHVHALQNSCYFIITQLDLHNKTFLKKFLLLWFPRYGCLRYFSKILRLVFFFP